MRGVRGVEQIKMDIHLALAQKPELLPGQEIRPPKNRNMHLGGVLVNFQNNNVVVSHLQ